MNERTRGRLQLVLIALVFIGPLLAAFVLYFGGFWKPNESSINGVLLDTTSLLPDDEFSTDLRTSSFRGKWSLIHVAHGVCAEACLESLYVTRQVREALNRDRDRVQRVLCDLEAAVDTQLLAAEHPGLHVLTGEFAACGTLAERLVAGAENDVLLADPLGNLIIRFPSDLGMRGMHRDLKMLLRVSRIG